MQAAIYLGYLPPEALHYRKTYFVTYDIEAFEEIVDTKAKQTITHAYQKFLSIAIGSNFEDSFCFVRENSSHEAVQKVIKNFVDTLEILHEKHTEMVPTFFAEAIDLMEQDCLDPNILKSSRIKLQAMRRFLYQYERLDVFGYNSGKNFLS